MSVIFTCGHMAREDENGHTISTKSYSRENNRAIDYRTVCNNCYHVYDNEDLILLNEADEARWLNE